MDSKLYRGKIFSECAWNAHENWLPEAEYEELNTTLENFEYEWVKQERFGHYNHVFKSESARLPQSEEAYCAEFELALTARDSEYLKQLCFKRIFPELKKYNSRLRFSLIPNVYRIRKGCYFRSHTDDYAGEIGFTLFVGQRWRWDFGGILTFVVNDKPAMIFPEPNTLLVRNEKSRPHHFVTQVPNYVNDHYFLIVGWASEEDLGSSSVRGSYFEI